MPILKPCKLGKIVLENGEEYFGEIYIKDSENINFNGLINDYPCEFKYRMKCQDGVERSWTENGKYHLPHQNFKVRYRTELPPQDLKIGRDVKHFKIEEL